MHLGQLESTVILTSIDSKTRLCSSADEPRVMSLECKTSATVNWAPYLVPVVNNFLRVLLELPPINIGAKYKDITRWLHCRPHSYLPLKARRIGCSSLATWEEWHLIDLLAQDRKAASAQAVSCQRRVPRLSSLLAVRTRCLLIPA